MHKKQKQTCAPSSIISSTLNEHRSDNFRIIGMKAMHLALECAKLDVWPRHLKNAELVNISTFFYVTLVAS